MAVGTRHVSFEHGMVMRELELCFLFHVTGKTHLGILAGIDDLIAFAAAVLRVQAPGAVAHLATLDLNALHRDGDTLVRGELKILYFLFMARGASFHANVLGAFHLMVFDDFLESFNVNIAARRKKRKRSKN